MKRVAFAAMAMLVAGCSSTVEADVVLNRGVLGRAAIPSGASCPSHAPSNGR